MITEVCSPALCGACFIASDGAMFYPAVLYNTAYRNIGIVEEKNGEKKIYSETLYTNPNMASSAALKMRNEYETVKVIQEERKRRVC